MPAVRTKEELLELDDDVGEQKKTQDKLDDTIETMFTNFKTRAAYPSERSLLDFGAQFGSSAAAAAKTTRALEDWSLNSNETLKVPIDPDGDLFHIDAMPPRVRSMVGEVYDASDGTSLKSTIKAASGFAPVNNTFFDLALMEGFGPHFTDITFDANFQCQNAGGVDTIHPTFSASAGFPRFTNSGFTGGTEYQLVGLQNQNSTPLVGAVFDYCGFTSVGGAGAIHLKVAHDDISFKRARITALGGDMDNVPIVIDQSINVKFDQTFYRNLTDFGAGAPAANNHWVKVMGGSFLIWNGGFFEINEITYSRLRTIFFVENGGAHLSNFDLHGDASTPPVFTDGALVKVFSEGNAGTVAVENVRIASSITGMDNVFELLVSDGGSSKTRECVTSGTTGFTNAYRVNGNNDTNGKTPVHLVGSHNKETYDHLISNDGSAPIVTDQRQVVAEVTFAAGTATVASAGAAVKVVATTTQKGAASGFTVGTDNTLTPTKPGFRRYHVHGIFDVDIASGTDNVTLHVFVDGASAFETASQNITSGTPQLFEVDVILEIGDGEDIELYAENEDAVVNVSVAASAERVDTTPAHGFLRVAQV